MDPHVYILASKKNGTLYTGVTSNLVQRIWQHREGVVEGFTQKYDVKTLVWFEQHATMASAISREKTLKKWNRAWKINLIEKTNPQWLDLWSAIVGTTEMPPPPLYRHPREGGDPLPLEQLDSRLRGNDEGGNSEEVA